MSQGHRIFRNCLCNQNRMILPLRRYVLEVQTVSSNELGKEMEIVTQFWVVTQLLGRLVNSTYRLQDRIFPKSWRCELQRIALLEDCSRDHFGIFKKLRRSILQRLAIAGHRSQNHNLVCTQLWTRKLERAATSLHCQEHHVTVNQQAWRCMLQGSTMHGHSARHDVDVSTKRFRSKCQCKGSPLQPREQVLLIFVTHGQAAPASGPASRHIVQALGPRAMSLPRACR
mmetsp:Transcript_39861/g.109710  ORF Transcript_39861/g.109710 Transcript_39861/m.109710 type:complete len:228 (-) Transcript_39861:157-840(-)